MGGLEAQERSPGGLARPGVALTQFTLVRESRALRTIQSGEFEFLARHAQLWVSSASSFSVCPLGPVPSLLVSVISACLFVSGSLAVSPSSPILLPREEAPEVACPLLFLFSLSLSDTHSLSFSSLQTQLWSSAATAAGKTCPCPHLLPPPLPCSPFPNQAPPVLSSLSYHVGPRCPQGP